MAMGSNANNQMDQHLSTSGRAWGEPVRPCAPPSRGDRKSTRLNSSHTVISYAVFCLKKKKTTTTQDSTTQKAHYRTAQQQNKEKVISGYHQHTDETSPEHDSQSYPAATT